MAEAQKILAVLKVATPRVDIAFFDTTTVSSANKLTIEATIALPEDAADAEQVVVVVSTWSLSRGALVADRSLENSARTPLSVSKSLDGNMSRSHPLVIEPFALVLGGEYVFNLEATLGTHRGYASISMTVIAPPSSGGLDVTPAAGFAFYTIFTLLAEGWVSAEPPLRYRFETERGILRTSSPNTLLENARFPIGIAPPSLSVTVVVTDALKSTANASREVNVTLSNTSLVVDDVDGALTTAFAKYSLDEICQVVASATDVLDNKFEVLETVVAAHADAVEDLVDPELEQLELSIEASRALSDCNLDNPSATEVLDVLHGLTSTLAGVGLSGNTMAAQAATDALSNLLASRLFVTADDELSQRYRRRRRLEKNNESHGVASDIFLEAVDALTLVQRETLVENEDAIGARASNLRTASKVVSNQLGEGIQVVGTTGDMNASSSSSSIVPDDGSVYAISLAEFLVNPHDLEEEGNAALSRVVRFGINVSSAGQLRTTASAATDVNLTIPGQVALNVTPVLTVTADCECGFVGFKELECPDSTVSIYCDGLAPGFFNYTCNSTSLACATWDVSSRRWVVPPSCETIEEDGSTRCECRVDLRDQATDYSTRREVTNAVEVYTQVFETKPEIRRSRLVLTACLGLVVITAIAAVVGECMDQRDARLVSRRKRYGSPPPASLTMPRSASLVDLDTPTTHALARRQIESIPGRSLRDVVDSLNKHHPILNWYNVYSATMPRKWRALKLGVECALIFLALALEVVWIEFPSVDCGAYDDETQCAIDARSLVSRRPLCKYDVCSASCVKRSTRDAGATVEHFVLLLLILAIVIPVLASLDWIIGHFIVAPVPPALKPAHWFCRGSSDSIREVQSKAPSGAPLAPESDAAPRIAGDSREDAIIEVMFEEHDETSQDPRCDDDAPRESAAVSIGSGTHLLRTTTTTEQLFGDNEKTPVENRGAHPTEATDSMLLVVDDDRKEERSSKHLGRCCSDDGIEVKEDEEIKVEELFSYADTGSTARDVYLFDDVALGFDEFLQPTSTDEVSVPSLASSSHSLAPTTTNPSTWPHFVSRCHSSLEHGRSVQSCRFENASISKTKTSTTGSRLTSKLSRAKLSLGIIKPFNQDSSAIRKWAANSSGFRMAAMDVHALAVEVVQNMKLGFFELQTCRKYAESNRLAEATMMLAAIERRLRQDWRWTPDEAEWEDNVLEMIRGHISEAWRLREEVEKIAASTPAATLVQRLERLVEAERASHLSLVEKRIYRMTVRKQTAKSSPSPAAYVAAWLVVTGIMAATIVVMLQVATTIGYDRARHWLLGVVVNLVLMFVVLFPLEIVIFNVALPSLIIDRLRRLDDPTALRTFPFAANVPASPVFFYCQLEPAYGSTRLGRINNRFDEVFLFDQLPGIHEDLTWTPSPAVRAGLRLCAALVTLPDYVQKPLFEEIVLLVATLGAIATSMLLDHITPSSQESIGELYFLLASVVAVALVVVFYSPHL
ncbi:hypothetical protein CTAYLR_004876 [Chrysophaeum taylorii]|uniref:PKD/REJ-like domain-containing protein n=1 Tax=Chrysophaeum taylorii TaxID=2483200 RepID=A0AAD7XKX9_9STRA|nr:hypothetical protein CTAYLR_004876 [Chrysophaeum taylorii]